MKAFSQPLVIKLYSAIVALRTLDGVACHEGTAANAYLKRVTTF